MNKEESAALEHVLTELAMFDHGDADLHFDECLECQAAVRLLLIDNETE